MTEASFRKNPAKGMIVRMPISRTSFCYGCVADRSEMWIFNFRTALPAFGSSFFQRTQWKWAVRFGNLSCDTVDCGRLKIEGDPYGPNGYIPRFYKELTPLQAKTSGWEHPYVLPTMKGYRAASLEEIREKGYHKHQWMTGENYRDVLSSWIPQMELREVPDEFIDRRDLAEVARKATPKQPARVELRIIFQEADLATDDPELEIEEPLEEALEDGEAGTLAGSGTEPGGLFVIDIETTSRERAKTLRIIRRVLKRLKCPASTTIEEAGEPPIKHPLEAPPAKKRSNR